MIINETENCIREDTMKPRRSRRGRGQNVVDCIDTHDFWGGFPTSGLNINGERHYYQSELVDIEKRASVKNGAIVKQYLNTHIIN